ncbi:MAG: transcriptional regulator GcvA [Pseudomonadota bacterium]
MSFRFPPLGALRTFRSAAHWLSFTQAAEELHVTQAAVSHQIKSLEGFLGKPLFVRGNRSLALSEYGESYLPYIDQMFAVLQEGTEQLMKDPGQETLTVTALPSFSTRWLVPRLGLFLKAHPEVDFRLAPSRGLTNFATEKIDLAIRYGSGRYPGLTSIHLLDENILPVCSPRLVKGKGGLKKTSDLRRYTLLHDEGHGDWRKWLLAADVHDVDASKGPVYTDSAMAVQSAIEGDGVALGRSQLVSDDIARGLLVTPFDIVQPSRFAYYIVYPEDAIPKPGMKAFISWIQEQVRLSSRDK